MNDRNEKKSGVKEKLIHEVKEFLAIFVYLALFFGAFTTYRLLVLKEMGISYFPYGLVLIKALVLAKVILLGQYAKVGKIFDDRPLIIPTLYKVGLFTLFALVFEVLEHAVGGLVHGKGLMGGLQELLDDGWVKFLSRTLLVMWAFIPFFAFTETGRVLGEGKLSELFLRRRTEKEARAGS